MPGGIDRSANEKCALIDLPTIEKYRELLLWIREYGDTLETLKTDHLFLTDRSLTPKPAIQLVTDAYDVITYCFPLTEVIDNLSESIREDLLRIHTARACIFYGIPTRRHVLLTPPHMNELISFIRYARNIVKMQDVQKELTSLLLNRFSPLSLASEKDEGKFIQRLCEDFKDLALLIIGLHGNGINVLQELIKEGPFTTLPKRLSDKDYFVKLYAELDSIYRDYSSKDTRREEIDYWIKHFRSIVSRSELFQQNKNDAISIQLLLEANKKFSERNVVFLLASSVDSMNKVIEKAANKAMFTMPNGQKTKLLRNPNIFFYYLQICEIPQMTTELTGDALFEISRTNLQLIKQQLEKINDFSALKEIEGRIDDCRCQLIKNQNEICWSSQESCPNADIWKNAYLKDKFEKLRNLKQKSENARLIMNHQPIITPHLSDELIGTDEDIRKSIIKIAKRMGDKDSFKKILRQRIDEFDTLVKLYMTEVEAKIGPFITELTDEFIENYFSFPYRIIFPNTKLNSIGKEYSKLCRNMAVRPTKDDVIALNQQFSDEASKNIDSNDVLLVNGILLFAFGKFNKVVSLLDEYLKNKKLEDDLLHELKYLRIRSLLKLYLSHPKKKRDINILNLARVACEEELKWKSSDPRYLLILGMIRSEQYFSNKIPTAEKPKVDEIEGCFNKALESAKKKKVFWDTIDDYLTHSIRYHWASFLAERGIKFAVEARNKLHEIPIKRDQWLSLWIEKDADIDRTVARATLDKKERIKLFNEALKGYKKAKDVAYSKKIRKVIDSKIDHLEKLIKDFVYEADYFESVS